MLRSCKWCGRIHDVSYDCGRKPQRKRAEDNEVSAFRRTNRWKRLSLAIRERDRNLCQVCLHGSFMTRQILTYEKVAVHHIIPISESTEGATDPMNLITLCPFHHELAESGYIPREVLRKMAEESENRDKQN